MSKPMSDRELNKLAEDLPGRPGVGFHSARVTPHPDSDEAKRRDKKLADRVEDMLTVDADGPAEHRQTFEVPHGCVPVQNQEGRATGGFVVAALADKLPGYKPVFGEPDGKLIAVRSVATPKAAIDKMESALTAALQPPLLDMEVPGYEPLRRVLEEAYNQSARGKGRVRHANEKPFLQQPIMEIGRMVGMGGHTYQISKKAQEATTLASRSQHAAAKAELLGVIVYAAAAFLLIEESE